MKLNTNHFFLKGQKKNSKSNRTNLWNPWPRSWDQDYPIKEKTWKNQEAKFLFIQISRDEIEKNQSWKGLKKQIAIKRMQIKSNIKK
jgi:hypothetical protein